MRVSTRSLIAGGCRQFLSRMAVARHASYSDLPDGARTSLRRLDQHRRERGHGRRRKTQAFGPAVVAAPGDRFIDVEVGDKLSLQVVRELFAPLRGARESVFLAIPAADHDGAPRSDAALLQLAQRTRQFHHGSCATRRVHAAVYPRVTMIAEQHPFIRQFAAANARLNDRIRLDAGVHIRFSRELSPPL